MNVEPAISADTPDWTREDKAPGDWVPAKSLLRCIRSYQHWKARGGLRGKLMAKYYNVLHRFWTVVSGADVPVNARIGGGLLLPHPNGIVIHSEAVIGVNCLLFQQVTLGSTSATSGAPVLGGHVDVGAGAKILGGVKIGDHARIGANAVVLQDVPAGAVAVGIPARILKS